MTSNVHYTITPVSLGGHRFAVTVSIPDPGGEAVVLTLPTWIPGSYLVRDFSKHVQRVSAQAEGKALRVVKKNKCCWKVEPTSSSVTVSYEVYAHDFSVRGAHLDSVHGFFNGSSVFLSVKGREDDALTVDINKPIDPDHTASVADWMVATTLPSDGAVEWDFGRYRAADYAELIDHPVEMGQFDLVPFEVAGVPHYFVLSGTHRCDPERLARDAELICSEQVKLIGELPKMDRYLFLTRVEGTGYGGLEHRSSCALVCTRASLPQKNATAGSASLAKEYRQFLGLVSHEYFHLWNVKRIKPAVFTPYALDGESYTELLWVFEGITSYYDDLALVRSGVIDEVSYADLLAQIVSRVRSAPGHTRQTLAESSFDAWIKFYKPDENSPNAVVSYYAKGALIALALDLTLRERSDHTLDDIMQAMWEQYGKRETGLPEDGFEELAEQVTGVHLRPFFDAMIRGTEEPDLESLLAGVGWQLSEAPVATAPLTTLGVTFLPGTTTLKTVRRDSCAERAGVSAGDTLVAIDNLQVKSDQPGSLLMPYTVGDEVSVHAFRRDELKRFDVTLDKRPPTAWKITPVVHPDSKTDARRTRWLDA